jgi:hypothetical protein
MQTVSFFGTVGAGAEKTLVSPRIGHPYKVIQVDVRFAQGCNNLLKMYSLVAIDNQESTSGLPNGHSVLSDYGQVNYVVGNDDTKRIKCSVLMQEGGSYLKVFGVNSDTVEHSMDCLIVIEEIERK